MSSPPTDVDPDLLARWIGIAGLIASATDLVRRSPGAGPRLALVSADTANEAVLGWLASEGPSPPPDRATFEQVFEGAVLYLRSIGKELPIGLRSRITETHRLRNAAIHHGSEPSVRAVARAIDAATRLRDVATDVSPILAAFGASGPVRAVAALVDIEPISTYLLAAADAQDAGDATGMADNAAIALDRALGLVRPSLEPWNARPSPFDVRDAGRDSQALRRLLEAHERQLEAVQAWVLAFGVGLQPRELSQLRRLIGRNYGSYQAPHVIRPDGATLDPVDVASAVMTVTDVIFRLWLADSLRRPDERPWDE